jgi:predicted nucleotidyltransferase
MDSRLAHFRDDINRLCAQHYVRRLDLFGSATGNGFNPAISDVDFLVEFTDLTPGDYAEHYFALKDGLTTLLGREVDLVVERAIKNPFFLESVQLSRESLFAA